MKQIVFSTGNSQKMRMGQTVCDEYGISLLQKDLDIDEVQSENSEYVAIKKAEAAFNILKQPVVISDDSWAFLGLNGFPGTYAKSVNHWLSADDLIRLMDGVADRRLLFTQMLAYKDSGEIKIFKRETIGTALYQPRGNSGAPTQKVVSFAPDKKTSIAEMLDSGSYFSGDETLQVWHDFAKWFKEKEEL
jgi:XTP/dITP diphosphohydrolase